MARSDSDEGGRSETRRRFRPGWRMTAFTVLLLPVVLSLGSWQLDRAVEKRQFENAYMDRIGALARAPGAEVAPFERLRLEGEYEPGRYFLLDNQTRNGEVGYGVVSSFLATDGRRWLINRGFIAGDRARRSLPEVRTPAGPVRLTGLVWPELGLMPVFGENAWPEGWPKRVQRLEVERMAALLPDTVAAEIRLEPGAPGVFAAAPLELNMPASKHTGYAVQWFGLAAALTIGYVIFGFKRQ
jgi:cytochrome oxidase assembly protein ShyY1